MARFTSGWSASRGAPPTQNTNTNKQTTIKRNQRHPGYIGQCHGPHVSPRRPLCRDTHRVHETKGEFPSPCPSLQAQLGAFVQAGRPRGVRHDDQPAGGLRAPPCRTLVSPSAHSAHVRHKQCRPSLRAQSTQSSLFAAGSPPAPLVRLRESPRRAWRPAGDSAVLRGWPAGRRGGAAAAQRAVPGGRCWRGASEQAESVH